MKIANFWILAATMFLLQIAENSNAAELSWTYHYTIPETQANETHHSERTLLTFSPYAMAKARNFINAPENFSQEMPFSRRIFTQSLISDFYKNKFFDDDANQEVFEKNTALANCILFFKNKQKDKILSENSSLNIKLCFAKSNMKEALDLINTVGQKQNKKIYLEIGTTSQGALEIINVLGDKVKNLKNIDTICFIPIGQSNLSAMYYDKEHVHIRSSSKMENPKKYKPQMTFLPDDFIRVMMCINSVDLQEFSHKLFTNYIENQALEYDLGNESAIKEAQKIIEEQQRAEDTLKKAVEIEIQRERERIAEKEQARKDDDFWEKESARQKKQAKEEEAAEQALRNSTQAEVNKKGKKIAEEQSQSEQAQKEAELKKLAELEKQLTQEKAAHAQKQIEQAAAICATEKAKKEAEAEENHKKALEKASENEKKRVAYAEEARQKFEAMMQKHKAQNPTITNNPSNEKKEQASTIKRVFSYRPVQFALALIALANVYHFFITSEQKDSFSSLITHYWEKLSHFSPSSALF